MHIPDVTVHETRQERINEEIIVEPAVDRGNVDGMIPSHRDLYPKYSNLKFAVEPTDSSPLVLGEVNNQPKHACKENCNDSPID